MFNLINAPESASHYEFIVAQKLDSDYLYWGAYTDGFKAEMEANRLDNAIIIHNVRIQGYQP